MKVREIITSGHSIVAGVKVTELVRWMGYRHWSFEYVVAALDKLNVRLAPRTVRLNLEQNGARGTGPKIPLELRKRLRAAVREYHSHIVAVLIRNGSR